MMFIIVVDSFLEKSRDEIDKSVWFDYIIYEVVVLCLCVVVLVHKICAVFTK